MKNNKYYNDFKWDIYLSFTEFGKSFCIYVSIDIENVRTKSFLGGKSLNDAY